MRDNHIINLLEDRLLESLSAAEIERINAHTADCGECLRAFEAARVSSRLLRERASVSVEPPPFFQTRILAAIREKNSEPFGFLKLWQAARALVASMAAAVVILTALTFLTDRAQPQPEPALTADAVEWTILDGGNLASDDMTYSQALTILYDQNAEGAHGKQQ
ncbi:MAG: anti-sigma factor [Blastocatellales bacterium]